MNKRMRVGLIGCGNIAVRAHAPALHDIAEVEVVGVADPVVVNRQQVQTVLGLPDAAGFTDHRALLDQGLDYVTLTAPPKFRRAIVEDCARAGVHVLSEKPLATIPAEGQAMLHVMQQAGLRFGLVHNYHFFPHFAQAKQLIDEGVIGKLRHVTLQWLGMPDFPGSAAYKPRWRHDPVEAGGGILMDMLHAVYLGAWYLGGPIRAVSAVVDNFEQPEIAVEDFSLVHLYGDSAYITINMWWGRGPNGAQFSGAGGHILHFAPDFTVGSTLPNFTLVNDAGSRTIDLSQNPYLNSFTPIHTNFINAIRTGSAPIAPGEAGLAALEATVAAYTSAAIGAVVSLPFASEHPVYQRGIAGLKELAVAPNSPVVRRRLFGL